MPSFRRRLLLAGLLASTVAMPHAMADTLPDTLVRIKPAVIGIATHNKLRAPAIAFVGTGFVVGDGLTVVTNAHCVNQPGVKDGSETLGILIGKGENTEFRAATIVAVDADHDLAQLRIAGTPLPAMKVGDSDAIREGQQVAFTGFPIGMVLGFHHATHRATVAAITPITRPVPNMQGLNARMILQQRSALFDVLQLDAIAFPGNSGSPVYDPDTGDVVGVINMVFVKGAKETALSQPTGITYAIPARFVRALLETKRP